MSKIEVTYIDHMGDDLRTSNSARVSFKKKREEFLFDGDPRIRPTGRSDEQLVKDLAAEGHIAPFGHSYALFHIKAPIFVARQLVKHKFLRWSEVSRRYVDDEPEFYMPDVWRGRSADKKQGSEGVVNIDRFVDLLLPLSQGGLIVVSTDDMEEPTPDEEDWTLLETYEDTMENTLHLYKSLLLAGVAPEQARMVLPQSTMTEWYWSGSLDAFAAMCKLRCASDTQYESRIVADAISQHMKELFPVSWEALME